MEKQNGFASIALVVVIVVIAGAVGYFALRKSGSISYQTPVPVPTKITKSPTPTPKNETANWKTYTNEEYEIKIKYPPYNSDLKSNIEVSLLDNTVPEEGPGAFWMGLAQELWHKRFKNQASYKVGDRCPINNEGEVDCQVYSLNPYVLKVKNEYSKDGSAVNHYYPYFLVFPTENFQMSIGPLQNGVSSDDLNQILNTFKFTK